MTDVAARILALLQTGDLASAAALAGEALAGGATHPLLFDARGHFLLQNEQYDAALEDFARALKLAPGNPALHDSEARCLIALDRAAEAVAACDRAIALSPRYAAAHYDKGCAHEMLGDLISAARCYREAQTLEPRMADAPARLASLATRRGDHAGAKALAARALALDPGNSVATLALATAQLGDGETTGLAGRLGTLAAASNLAPQIRANALGLLGDALDREGRTSEAFAAYAAGNATLEPLFAPRFAGIESGVSRVQRLARDFAQIDPVRWRLPAPPDAPAHVFVLGFYRAGTTLLGQVLASHPEVITLEEQPVMVDATRDFLDTQGGLERLAGLDAEGAETYRALYWRHVHELAPASAGKIIVDKLPLNSIALPVIAKLFPAAKVVFAIRDPRDVVFSCFRRLLAVNRDTYEMLDLARGARFYAATMELAVRYRTALAIPVLDVRNEDLAADFENQVRRICGFIGSGWDDSMLHFAEQSKSRAIATPSAAQVARGINSSGVDQWRRYCGHLTAALLLLEPWAAAFGYRPD